MIFVTILQIINIFNMTEESPLLTELSKQAIIESPEQHALDEQEHNEFIHQENSLKRSPFYQYFSQQIQVKSNLQDIEKKYNQHLENKLESGIADGTVKFSRKKKELKIKSDPQPTQEEILSREKHYFHRKKQQVLDNLHEIYQEQKDLLIKNRSFMKQSRIHRSQSQILQDRNQNWLEDIKKAIKRNKDFNSSVKKKDNQFKQKLFQIKQEEINQRIRHIQKLRENNHAQVEKKQKEEKNKKEKFEQLRKNSESIVKKVKPVRYVHQKLEEQFKQKMRKVESENTLKLDDVKRRRQIDDWDSFKEHEERYLDTLQERKWQWIDQFNSKREQQLSDFKYFKGKYAEKARQEELKIKQEIARDGERGGKVMEKMRNYNQYVSEHFKPKIMAKKQNPETPENPSKKHFVLDRTAIRMKGLEYLSRVKQTVKALPQSQVRKSASLPKIKNETSYKNYLREMPSRRKEETSTDQFKSALTERRGKWAESALNLISKMEVTDCKKGDKPLISSVYNKIELLNAMNEDD